MTTTTTGFVCMTCRQPISPWGAPYCRSCRDGVRAGIPRSMCSAGGDCHHPVCAAAQAVIAGQRITALPSWKRHSNICTACRDAGANGDTDAENGLTDGHGCGARACDNCGARSCDPEQVSDDTCSGITICADDDCRRTYGYCRGCPRCGDPDDYHGGRDR